MSLTLPTVGGDGGVWATKLNTAIATVNDGVYARLATAPGTDPTGVTECAAAVQSFITANAGRTILVNGTYKCGTQLAIPSNTELIGEGQFAGFAFTWTTTSGGSCYIGNADMVGGNSNIRLRGLLIQGAGDGTPFGSPTPGPATGVLLRLGSDIEISDCRFYRVPGVSVAYQGVQRIQITGNKVYQGGRDGITGWWYNNSLSDVVVANNIINTVGDDGIAINASTAGNPNTSARPRRISITGNTIYGQPSYYSQGSGRGIVVLGVEDCTITGNSISDTFASNITVTADAVVGSSLFRCRNITVSGNICRRGGQAGDGTQPQKGIRVTGTDHITITGNTVSEAASDGIYLNDVSYFTVSGNVAHENGTNCTSSLADCGITLDGGSSTRNVISGQVIGNATYLNAASGIRSYYADRCAILGNQVVNNGNASNGTLGNGAGIYLGGDTIFFCRQNHVTDTRSGGSRTQTYGIYAPALGGSPTLEITDNYSANHPGPNINIGAAPAFIARRGNHEGSTMPDTVQQSWPTQASNYTLTLSDYGIFSNGTSLTHTLPTAASAGKGRAYAVFNSNSSAVTVNVASAGTINGASSVTVPQNTIRFFVSDGSNWFSASAT